MPTITVIDETCKACHLCIPVCKPGLLHRGEGPFNRAGYAPVRFADPDRKCTACKVCAQVCPDVAIRVFK
ncbi:MAG: 4Fe-4S binding protein [Candidatus Sericytochromatia bacterium]|nr:4Fe-4S binding protein [Candidatus Tanganyikabacteria bacterium]